MKKHIIVRKEIIISREKILAGNFYPDNINVIQNIDISDSEFVEFMLPAVELIYSLVDQVESKDL